MTTSVLLEHFSLIASTPGSLDELREFVLDLGVRGRLAPQLAGEASIGDALDSIWDGLSPTLRLKVPGRPSVPRVPDDWEHRFPAPEGWAWARVNDTGGYVNGLSFDQASWADEGLPIIRIQNLTNPRAEFNRATGDFPPDRLVDDGDILVSWSATLDAFIWNRGPAVLNQHIFKVIPDARLVDRDFLYHLLRYVIRNLARSEAAHGLAMKHINRGPFLAFPVALPPLQEQKRIVQRLGEVLELCARLELALAVRTRCHNSLTSAVLGLG
jgi:type I restriction enzyme S subunit